MLASTVVSAAGSIASGRAADAIGKSEQRRLAMQGDMQKQVAEYEAKQLEYQGKEEQAAAQREAEGVRRQKKLALSRLQAVGAGSGFSATDPTALGLAGDIEKYGTYQEDMTAYGGKARRASLDDSAHARRYSGEMQKWASYQEGEVARATGRAQRNAGYFNAAGTILGGVSDMGSKYAKRKPVASAGRYG
jgi:hypothetical protein